MYTATVTTMSLTEARDAARRPDLPAAAPLRLSTLDAMSQSSHLSDLLSLVSSLQKYFSISVTGLWVCLSDVHSILFPPDSVLFHFMLS